MPAPPESFACWVVTDGRAGNENQALGLAEAAARLLPLKIIVKRIQLRAPWRSLPRALWGDPFPLLSPLGALLRPPFPALWIACGRQSSPYTMAVKELSPSIFAVQTQDPRAPLAKFDLVVPPLHDNLQGANVFPIVGAPNRITRAGLDQDAAQLGPALDALARPRIAALIGGPNRAFSMDGRRVTRIARTLRALARDGAGIMVTTSRRTPAEAAQAIARALSDSPHFLWSGASVAGLENPYCGMLGLADHILVTEDSVNMAAEAAMTGKPVHILPLDRRPLPLGAAKFERFHASLRQKGAARRLMRPLASWTYAPLDETARAARELARRFLEARDALRD